MSSLTYKIISAILAFLLWALWAYFVNIDSSNRLLSAFGQGIASFIITLIMIRIIEYFYNLLPKNGLYFFLPSLITVFITSSFVVFMHIIIKTSNIFITVLPTVIVALAFSIYTTYKIKGNSNVK